MFQNELIHYIFRITPGVIAFFIFFYLVPRSLKLLRIVGFILLFALTRDAMTPEGLWTITNSLEIRFISQPNILLFLAFSSVALVILSHFVIGNLRDRGLWLKRPVFESVGIGLFSGVLVALLPYCVRILTAQTSSPRPGGFALIASIFALTFLGNLLEETIFRGHFQTYLSEQNLSRVRVILLSGLMFSICHTFLAFTVTNVGWPILIFTMYEGTICAFLRERNGLLAAAIAHGTGLFLVGTGIVG